MAMFLTIERPTSATTRPVAAAESSTCWTRCTCEAKHATMTRPGAFSITLATTRPTSCSLGMNPGTSALVESDSSMATPRSPRREKPGRSVSRPSSGVWSILKSPVCTIVPAPVVIATASASGIEWLTARNSSVQSKPAVPAASRTTSPSRTRRRSGFGIRCCSSLPASSARVSREPRTGISARSRRQIRDPADVVLVAVRHDDRVDVVEPIAEPGPVREHQVDAGGVGLAQQDAAVDDQQPPGRARRGGGRQVLEDRHVAPDLADAAQRDHPQRARGQGAGQRQLPRVSGLRHEGAPFRRPIDAPPEASQRGDRARSRR